MRALILSVFILVVAQTGPLPARELDLQSVIALAEQNNRTIQLAKLDVQMAQAEKKGAYATAFPRVSTSFGLEHEFLDQSGGITPAYNNTFQLGAILDQTLFDMRVLYAITASRALNQFTDFQYETTRQRIITVAKKSFYGAVLAREVFQVAQRSEESARENYENIRIRFDSGVVSEYELLQAEVNWRNTVPERIRARRDFELALNSLKVLIGLSQEEEIVLTGTLSSYPQPPLFKDVEALIQQRPDIQALQWQKNLQEINLRAQQSAFYPTLTARMSYLINAASDDFRWENDEDSLRLGLLLAVPVFSGGNTKALVRKAQTEVGRVSVRLAQTREEILVEMSNIRLRLEEAEQRIESAEKNVGVARRAFEIAETRVENQLATQLELKEIRVALDLAQVTYYSAIYDYLSAYFDWEEVTGRVRSEGI
ncbi:MAG: TolC family protein [Spirochaetaceae bacterium]|nr:MAG: TolC family protein [Spirochaetaceae bacterium]